MEKENCAYLLRCADGTLYAGWTNDPARRVRMHNSGKGAKYTRSRRPVVLVYCERFATRQEAMRRERELKRLTHAQKLRLAQGSAGGDGGLDTAPPARDGFDTQKGKQTPLG